MRGQKEDGWKLYVCIRVCAYVCVFLYYVEYWEEGQVDVSDMMPREHYYYRPGTTWKAQTGWHLQ